MKNKNPTRLKRTTVFCPKCAAGFKAYHAKRVRRCNGCGFQYKEKTNADKN
jgi:uncharacterized protein (DUF983 family)